MLVNPRYRRGRKLMGTRSNPQKSFHDSRVYPGMRAFRLSAKRMTSATQAATSSIQNSIEIAILARGPNETYARSENVTSELSTSRHFARSFAVYWVDKAA
jgi:hypothetical protein